jgi:hypothetical protein
MSAPMSLQGAFSTVWEHAKKGERSAEAVYGNRCLYFGPANRNCFLGVLMPGEWSESEDIETLTAEEARARLIESGILSEDVGADSLAELQWIHDKFDPSEWNARLRRFAHEHNLSVEE